MVLCGASSYEEKYYLNPDFDTLPDHIKKELQTICVTHTMQAGGILTLRFDQDGKLYLESDAAEADFFYDDIGSELMIKRLLREKTDLFASLELYYKVFIKGDKKID